MALRGTQRKGKLRGMEFIVTDLPSPELWEGAATVPLLFSPSLLLSSSPFPLPSPPFPSPGQTQSLLLALPVTQAQPSGFLFVYLFVVFSFNLLYLSNTPPEGLRVQLLIDPDLQKSVWGIQTQEAPVVGLKGNRETHGQLGSSR